MGSRPRGGDQNSARNREMSGANTIKLHCRVEVTHLKTSSVERIRIETLSRKKLGNLGATETGIYHRLKSRILAIPIS